MTAMIIALVAFVTASSAHAETPPVIGWTEQVRLRSVSPNGSTAGPIGNPKLTAKIDTGAETSSVDAHDITTIAKDGAEWVRFTVTDADGKAWPLEAEIVRTARIRRAGAAKQRRLVVRLMLCVAGQTGVADFTLTDRRGQDAPVLVGRAFLAGRFLVDSKAAETAPDACGPS